MHQLVLNGIPPCNCRTCRTDVSLNTDSGIREVTDDDPMLSSLGVTTIIANERRKELAGMAQRRLPQAAVPVANEVTEDWPPTLNYAEMAALPQLG